MEIIEEKEEITASKCPHRTGVYHAGYYECEMGKACDYDCEWYQLQKYKECLTEVEDLVENHIMQDAREWLTLSPEVVEDYVIANCKQILAAIKKVKS